MHSKQARKYSPSEPVSAMRGIQIVECGEPLVSFEGLHPRLRLSRPRFRIDRLPIARRSVVDMLVRAAEATPREFTLAVSEGWRSPNVQRRLYRMAWNAFAERHPDWSDVKLRRVVNRYAAPHDHPVPSPHSTGGAVDVFLADPDGRELNMMEPFERRHSPAYHSDATGLTEKAAHYRKVLFAALEAGGLTNYPSEYWHWSYGDQGWAYRTGAPHALYDRIEPEGYVPSPEELLEDPIEVIEYPD